MSCEIIKFNKPSIINQNYHLWKILVSARYEFWWATGQIKGLFVNIEQIIS
jgi:hypothetical protein